MHIYLLKILFLIFIATNTYSLQVEVLNDNIKQNINNLSLQLKYLLSNNKLDSSETSNYLNIYYQHYSKIEAIEIVYNDKKIYTSYRNDNSIIILKDDDIPSYIVNNSFIYEKNIFEKNNSSKLIVYLKKEINFTKEEEEFLKNKKVLKIQNDLNLPPYNFNENGIAKGYSVDYINLIANKLNIQVEYTSGKWEDFLNMLEAEQLDLMMNTLKSEERSKKFLYSNTAYLSSSPAMVTRIAERSYHSLNELDGKTIALIKGYYSYDLVKKDYPNINIYTVQSTLESLKAVSEKKADLTYGLKDVVEYNINKNLFSDLKITDNIDTDSSNFYFMYNKNNTILKNIIEKAKELISQEEIDKLNKKWFNKIEEIENKSKDFLFTQEEINYLENKRKITMCVDSNFLPYEQVTKEGRYIGIIADIMDQLSTNSNIKFQLNITKSWDESFNLVKNKRCDILPFAVQTTSRDQFFLFTQTYLKFPTVIVTKDDELFINSIKELGNKRIALVKNFALVEMLKQQSANINILEVKNIKEGLEKVEQDEAYAFIGSMPTIVYTKQKYNIPNIKISGKIESDLLAKIAIRNDEKILQSILNKAINSLKEEDTERIVNKWITIIKDKEFNTKLFIQIVISLIIIFVIIVIILIVRSNRKLSAVNKKLEISSQTDKLTSLYNRAKLDTILEQEIKYKKRYETSLSLIIADIDYFKNINDTYGHVIGDIILKEFAHILSKNIRETDYVGRWGGEEFILIFPQTKDSDAHIITENLRKIIEENNFYNNIKITASFGINECKDDNPTKCVSKADKALYEAKNSNRNCVKVFNITETTA
jgi:polar amino acid transport system substrate-binding protein